MLAQNLRRAAAAIDAINAHVGRFARWLVLAMLAIQATTVVLRYIFGTSYVYIGEAVLYLHATAFMLGAGYTLMRNQHVRVDIFYSRLSRKGQALIDLLGTVLFLWPTGAAILTFCFKFVVNSWVVREGALNVGGIPATYLLKTLIPLFAVLLIIQGVAWFLRGVATLRDGGEAAAAG